MNRWQRRVKANNIPEGWTECKLRDIADIKMGQSPKSESYNNSGEGLPFLQGSRTFGSRYPLIDTYCTDPKRIANKGEILFSVRAPVGDINIAYRKICIGRGLASLNAKNQQNLFLFYLLHFIKDDIINLGNGTVFESVNKSDLESVSILLPPLPEQRAIASVLSSLDDKIDLLHRENKTLEAMAETLFRKWFIEEAEDDWEGVPLGDSTLSTIIKSGINFFEGAKFYLETNDVNNTDIVGGIPVTYADRPSRANMEPVVYSVWFSKKQGTRKLLMFDEYSKYTNKLILSTGFTGLKTTELSHYYIWCYVMSPQFQKIKDNLVTGSVQPDITNDNVKKIIIPKPDNETLLKFNSVVKEFFYKISLNQVQIRTLTQLRDTLLPKLMSGEVRVDLCQS